ncbi:MAG: hypothetical protein IJF08_04540, partial [Clostridia bacterium]|nr:hypothetical protein [Clostridia bacterium]
ESKALYDQIIPGVLTYLLEQGGAGAEILRGKGGVQQSVITRDSYVAALCSHRIKKRIEVHYCSISRSHELRFAVTDMVKYTENRIRAHMGVKSRLSVTTLSDAIKREMDAYLDQYVPKMKSREQEQTEQYERLYDLPAAPLDLSHSAEIEQQSWETTRKLIEAFEDAELTVQPTSVEVDGPKDTTPVWSATVGADVPDGPKDTTPVWSATVGADVHDGPKDTTPIWSTTVGADVPDGPQGENALADALATYLPFIAAAAEGNAVAQKVAAREMGRMIDAVADEINEIAAEIFGDVIIEEGEDGYVIIEDYREQISFLWRR